MKVAYLSQVYPPMISGAAIVTSRLAEGIATRQNPVLVVTASECDAPYRIQRNNLVVARLASYRNPLRIGQRFTLWPHKSIQDLLNGFSPDILHLHDPLQYALSGLKYGCQTGTPAVLTVHQLPWFLNPYLPNFRPFQEIMERVLWAYARWILPKFTAVIAPTRTIADIIATHTGVIPQVISNGVDLKCFHPNPQTPFEEAKMRARLGIPPQAPVILHVGRLDADKRVERVVRAAALVMEGTDAHLLVVGGGTERSKLVHLCQKMGIEERSHLPGYILLYEGLPAVYRLGSVFVTASEIETQGLVLLEAAACGIPIVAVKATCIPEIVHDGVNGLLVPSGNVEAMAAQITHVLLNPAPAKIMGKAGISIAQDHAIEKTLDAYETCYHSVVFQPRLYRKQGNTPASEHKPG